MFGRISPIIAMVALTTHLWVSMVVAPWHRLVEHHATVAEPAAEKSATPSEIKAQRGCRCKHHRCAAPTENTVAREGSTPESVPAIPDHDDCEVCQILAQCYVAVDLPVPELAWERVEFRQLETVVQPLLGCLTDPVSRGPPVA